MCMASFLSSAQLFSGNFASFSFFWYISKLGTLVSSDKCSIVAYKSNGNGLALENLAYFFHSASKDVYRLVAILSWKLRFTAVQSGNLFINH